MLFCVKRGLKFVDRYAILRMAASLDDSALCMADLLPQFLIDEITPCTSPSSSVSAQSVGGSSLVSADFSFFGQQQTTPHLQHPQQPGNIDENTPMSPAKRYSFNTNAAEYIPTTRYCQDGPKYNSATTTPLLPQRPRNSQSQQQPPEQRFQSHQSSVPSKAYGASQDQYAEQKRTDLLQQIKSLPKDLRSCFGEWRRERHEAILHNDIERVWSVEHSMWSALNALKAQRQQQADAKCIA